MTKIAFFTSAPPRQPVGMNFSEKLFPLGVGFLLSVLKSNGYKVDFYDRYLTEDISFSDKDYEYVCIYSNTPCFEDTLRVIEHYRGKSKVLVGGPHTSVYPDTLEGVDWIVQGEGEQAIIDILSGGVDKGIVKYPRIRNLDMLPRPDYELFSKMPYCTRVKWFDDQPVYNYNSSRGCPFRCTFCDVKRIWGRQYTYFSTSRVISDIEHLVEVYGVRAIYFREDNFTCNKKRLHEICRELIDMGLYIKWLCETRVNSVDEATVELMSRSGCAVWYVGFESGSQKMLDLYQKDTTVKQGIRAADLAHKYGIKVAGSFITDHPEETIEDKKLTQEFINRTRLTTVWMNKFRPSFDNMVKEIINAKRYISN